MRVQRRWATAVAVAVTAMVLPAAAQAGPAATAVGMASAVPLQGGLGDLALPAVQRQGVDLLQVGADGAPRHPRDVLAALPSIIEAAWGSPPIQLLPHDGEVGDADQDEDAEDGDDGPGTGVVALAGRLGYDADGDGLQDVAGYAYDLDADAGELFAWDGATGETIWTTVQDLDAWAYYGFVADDLTADGIDDLVDLVFTDYVDSSTCEETAPEETTCTYDERFTWHVDVISGATGERAMRRTQEGWFRGQEVMSPTRYAADLEARNLGPFPVPTDDHDGDGARDVVVHDTDITYHAHYSEDTAEHSLRSDVTATVLGAGWAPIATFATGDAPGIPQLTPAGDLTGDGTTDLVWATDVPDGEETVEECPLDDPLGLTRLLGLCASWSQATYATQLDIVDGADFSTASSTTVRDTDGAFAHSYVIADDDVTGDGAADIRVLTFEWFGETELMLIDGRSGELVWTYVTDDVVGGGYPSDFDGDGDEDLVLEGTMTLSSYDGATDEGSTTVTLFHTVLDGETSEVLSDHDISTSRDYAANAFVWSFGAGLVDVTGDGRPDPRMESAFGTYDGESDTGSFESVLRVLDGADPTRTLLDHDGVGIRVVSGAAQLFGDATPHLLEVHSGDEPFGGDRTLSAVEGSTGATAWTLPAVTYADVVPRAGGGDDVLITGHAVDGPHMSSTIRRLDGDTLTPVWARRFG